MAKNKTAYTEENVSDFIHAFVDNEQKRKDSFELMELMQNFTGYAPKMFGPSIIGFGIYHYKYESGHEGDAPLVAFSPRKAAISLYVYSGYMGHTIQDELLQNLGKFKMGKSCIYVKKLSDIDLEVLKKIMQSTIDFLETKYGRK